MKKPKTEILLLILLAILIVLLFPRIFHKSYKDLCKEDEEFARQIKSDPLCKDTIFACVDGNYIEFYYDKRLSPSNEPISINATIARYTRSSCYCEQPVIYEIRIGSNLTETSCKEFHRFIQFYNSSCNGCVGISLGGCC